MCYAGFLDKGTHQGRNQSLGWGLGVRKNSVFVWLCNSDSAQKADFLEVCTGSSPPLGFYQRIFSLFVLSISPNFPYGLRQAVFSTQVIPRECCHLRFRVPRTFVQSALCSKMVSIGLDPGTQKLPVRILHFGAFWHLGFASVFFWF